MEVVDDDYSRADHTNWPMGHVAPVEGDRRLTLEPLIYNKPKPIALGNRPQSAHKSIKNKNLIGQSIKQ